MNEETEKEIVRLRILYSKISLALAFTAGIIFSADALYNYCGLGTTSIILLLSAALCFVTVGLQIAALEQHRAKKLNVS